MVNDTPHIPAIQRIEALSRRDPGGRGLAGLAKTGGLLSAAQSLLSGRRTIVATGFCIRSARVGETDGPSGALALADALRRIGQEVVLVSDHFSSALLSVGATRFGSPFPMVILSQAQNEADQAIQALLADFAPTHVIAVERPGSAIDGHRYSMRGEMLDDLVPAADRLLEPGFPRPYATIAIGDGGNELGLGSLRQALKDRITHGELIFCATAADHVIPAGISNWGAFALVATLSLLTGQRLLRPVVHEHTVLESLVSAGAVDGCTRKNEISVDGIAWPDYANIIAEIYREIETLPEGPISTP